VIYGWKVKDDKSLQDGSQKFWGLYFQLELGNTYTLTIYDDVDDQPLGPSVYNIVPHEFFPNIAISYPIAASDNPVPSEFIAYGTSDSGGGVTGTISNCGGGSTITQYTPPTPPTDWNLYCNIVMGGTNCDLKVSQGGTDVHSTGLSFT